MFYYNKNVPKFLSPPPALPEETLSDLFSTSEVPKLVADPQ